MAPYGQETAKILTFWGTETWFMEDSMRESSSWGRFELGTSKTGSQDAKIAQHRPSNPKKYLLIIPKAKAGIVA